MIKAYYRKSETRDQYFPTDGREKSEFGGGSGSLLGSSQYSTELRARGLVTANSIRYHLGIHSDDIRKPVSNKVEGENQHWIALWPPSLCLASQEA